MAEEAAESRKIPPCLLIFGSQLIFDDDRLVFPAMDCQNKKSDSIRKRKQWRPEIRFPARGTRLCFFLVFSNRWISSGGFGFLKV
ncbi:hypothetical protein Csa_001658 [Cucumis sativus]|uniref:Uncharacterized protein n=1 Tax=Cucumis sativus TaxID=3659 RepID=A0A0A0LCY7_CUCSA|nr:hypothetical protein Csa_001658 [Cucumis sativus]